MTKNNFFRDGVTYLIMLSGIIFGAHFFQRIKFEFKNKRPTDPVIVCFLILDFFKLNF